MKFKFQIIGLFLIALPCNLLRVASGVCAPAYFPQDSVKTDSLSIPADSLTSPKEITVTEDSAAALPQKIFRKINNKAFRVGEHLIFEIAYEMVVAGTATMSVPDTQWVHGRPCYHIITTAKSNSILDAFHKVRDKVETLMDMDGLFPWKYEKHLREGRYKSNRHTDFDHFRNLAFYKEDTIAFEEYAQDVLSAFYLVRTLPLEVGKIIEINGLNDGKSFPLRIKVHKKEKIRVPAGKFNCFVVEPAIEGEGLFVQQGRMAIWLTDDERRIPVLMKSKVPVIGSIDARLKTIETRYELPELTEEFD